MKRLLILLGAALTLPGCAKLLVEVDVLNPSYVAAATSDSNLMSTGYALARGDHGEVMALAQRLRELRRQELVACYAGWLEFAGQQEARAVDQAQKDGWRSQRQFIAADRDDSLAGKLLDQVYSNHVAALLAFDTQALPILMTPDDSATDKQRAPGLLQNRLDQATLGRLSQRRVEIEKYINVTAEAGRKCPDFGAHYPSLGAAKLKETQPDGNVTFFDKYPHLDNGVFAEVFGNSPTIVKRQYATVAQQTLIGGGALLHDRDEAFFVTSAPDVYWAPEYNKALGQGEGGSTDVVLKLNDTGAFTVKGFVFDVRSTADMVKKVGTSALSLIASAYGAPVSISKPTGATAATPVFDAAKPVQAAETTLAVESAREAAYKAGLRASADAILVVFDRLKIGTDANAKKAAKGVFDARKNAWKAGTVTPAAAPGS